jgi:WD40 repeat protein
VSTDQPSLYAIGFTPDDRQIITAGSNRLCLWDSATLKRVAGPVVLVREAYRLAFQPGGSLVASNDGEELLLWDTHTLDLRRLPAHDGDICTIAFSALGQMLVTGGSDGTLWLWDVPSQHKLAALVTGFAKVPCASFSNDGHLLAAGMIPHQGEPQVRIWNVGQSAHVRATDTPKDGRSSSAPNAPQGP